MDDFISDINSISGIGALESLRDQLANQAATAEVTWQSRFTIYKEIPILIQQITQLEQG